MHHLLEIWFGWVLHWGYLGIIILMAMESSIFPVPSELVIPPAAFLAAQGHLNFTGVILAGTFGSYLGAAITYWVSLVVGRPVVRRYGKYFSSHRRNWSGLKSGCSATKLAAFFARLLPVIRHLISIPAGIMRMNFWVFSAVTIVGSAVWYAVLAYLGDRAYRAQPDLLSNPDGLIQLIKAKSFSIVLVVAGLAVLSFLVLRLTAKRASTR